MRTRNSQSLYDKINEEQKYWSVEVEYEVAISVYTQALSVTLNGASEEFGSEEAGLSPAKIKFSGAKTFEVPGVSEEEVRKRFEDLSSGEGWDLTYYIGGEYITEGFDGEVESAEVRVVSIEAAEP